jgi:tripartite-type tricarboxylate transporter receptor subunit TctC
MTRLALALVTLLSLAHPLRAEPAYPRTTIRIVLGFSPGSAPDVAARILAERFTAA